MKKSLRLCATATAAGSTLGLKPAPLALLPPIPLYRRLFRTHRKFLPKELRILGDEYVKHEFRQHQNIDNPMHIASLRLIPYFLFAHVLADHILSDWFFDRVADVCPKDRR